MKIKILNGNPYTPKYESDGAAAVDLMAVTKKKSGNFIFPLYTYCTGITLEIPKGYFAMVTPRSSISKKVLMLANSVGIIDSDYRGKIILKFRGFLWFKPYSIGDKIGQMTLMRRGKFEFVPSEKLSETKRGKGGFGSTDEKLKE